MSTFGYTTIGTTNEENNLLQISGSKAVLSEKGWVSKLTAYGDFYPAYTQYMKGAIYDISLNLVAETPAYPTAEWYDTEWHDLAFSSAVLLEPGTYWLVVANSYIDETGNAVWIYYDNDAINCGLHQTVSYDSAGWTFPSTLSPSYDTNLYSLYATYYNFFK